MMKKLTIPASVAAAIAIVFVGNPGSAPAQSAADLFVGDLTGDTIWRVDPVTGDASVFANLDHPEDLEMHPDGGLIVMQHSTRGALAQITAISADGLVLTPITVPGEIVGAEGPSLDAAGNLYVQSRGNLGVYRLSRNASEASGFDPPELVIRGTNSPGTSLPVHDAAAGEGSGVLFLGTFAGELLVTAPNEDRVDRFTPGAPFLGPFPFAVPSDFGNSRTFGPVDVKQACDGNVYVTDAASDRLLRFSSDGAAAPELLNTGALPAFITAHEDGIVYFTHLESNPARIGRFDTVNNVPLADLIIEEFRGPLGIASVGCTPPVVGEDEGCTPGYWKNHPAAWGPTGLNTTDLVGSVFSNAALYGLDDSTLLEALRFRGGRGLTGAARILLRAAAAARLNAAHDVNYPRTVGQVVADVNAALNSQNRGVMLNLAGALDADNSLGCPLK